MADCPKSTILLLGDADCGKSTFISRISQGSSGSSTQTPLPLLHDTDQPFVFNITFYNRPYRFEFCDTSSPEHWSLLQPDVIVLCYDISSRLSLINAQRLWAKAPALHFTYKPTLPPPYEPSTLTSSPPLEIETNYSSAAEKPVLLLGLKRDLRSENDPNGIIYPQEGYRIAQELRCDRYLECSAITGELVREVFEDICRTAALGTKKEGGGLSEGGCRVM